MKERPIVFTDDLVRAALAGRLTEIRVPVRDASDDTIEVVPSLLAHRGDLWDFQRHLQNPKAIRCPLGAPGDVLWVQEAHGWAGNDRTQGAFFYREDASRARGGRPASISRWRPAKQMPRRYSRLLFELLLVRVERLHAITEQGAIASGAFHTTYPPHECRVSPADDSLRVRTVKIQAPGWSMGPTISSDECLSSARMAFANWWNRRYAGSSWNLKPGPSPWDRNEWVFVATVRRRQP